MYTIYCQELKREVEVDITYWEHAEPNPRADNPDDFYGYTDIEYELYNIGENVALRASLSEEEEEEIKQRYTKEIQQYRDDARVEAYLDSLEYY